MKKLETMTLEEEGKQLELIEKHLVHSWWHHKDVYQDLKQRYHEIKRHYDRRIYGRNNG